MILRDVERLEAVVVRLHLGAVHDVKAHRLEDVDDIVEYHVERMQTTALYFAAGHRDISFSASSAFSRAPDFSLTASSNS